MVTLITSRPISVRLSVRLDKGKDGHECRVVCLALKLAGWREGFFSFFEAGSSWTVFFFFFASQGHFEVCCFRPELKRGRFFFSFKLRFQGDNDMF